MAPPSSLRVLSQSAFSGAEFKRLASTGGEQGARLLFHQLSQLVAEAPETSAVILGVALTLVQRREEVPDVVVVASAPFATTQRETAGALASLVAGATESLCFCSYVLAYIDELLPLFRSANDRGVHIAGIVDKACMENEAGRSAIQALHVSAPRAELFVWTGAELESTLHAKFLVTDTERVWLSSANLTGRAITNNVELGVVIENTKVATEIENLFHHLIASSNVRRLET